MADDLQKKVTGKGGQVEEANFDFLEMESCKISGMTSSFRSDKDVPKYVEPKFTDVESEEFWQKASYKSTERNKID